MLLFGEWCMGNEWGQWGYECSPRKIIVISYAIRIEEKGGCWVK